MLRLPSFSQTGLLLATTATRAVTGGLLPLALVLLVVHVFGGHVHSEELREDQFGEVAHDYHQTARPLLERYCLDCHSTALQEGELDLEQFADMHQVRQATAVWQSVVEMLSSGEMPPEDADPRPSEAERARLVDWVQRYLRAEALASAGDPGPVVLRRLSNAEYTYTVRDLTGINLDPAREFPNDGAAGEGFTNVGNAMAMSPALLSKYLDAGKQIAEHAMLLPDGFRFSMATTRRDRTQEALDRIRSFYGRFAEAGGGTKVNLQGIQFETNSGGRLAFEPYLTATLEHRSAIRSGTLSLAQVAERHQLNAKYLDILWKALDNQNPSILLRAVRQRWESAGAGDESQVAAEIQRWQESLFHFSSVGHIGKVGGPTSWQEPVTPLASRQELRVKFPDALPDDETVLYLVVSGAGDGSDQDVAVWYQPRIVAPGRPDLPLRDVRTVAHRLETRRRQILESTAKSLAAVEEFRQLGHAGDITALARRYEVDPESLAAWIDFLGIESRAHLQLNHLTGRLTQSGGYDFVQGWGSPDTPSLVANSSDQHVRIPGNMKPHGVCVHPAPATKVAVGWQSPMSGSVRISGQVTHAHPECGNGVAWSLELRRGTTRQQLAAGTAQGSAPVAFGPIENLVVQSDDLISLLIGPRDGNHACDLTDIEIRIASSEGDSREWNLTSDVAADVLSGNPHSDRLGNRNVWHFYTEPVDAAARQWILPAGSLLARWQAAKDVDEKQRLAGAVQELLAKGPPAGAASSHPDAVLYRQLTSWGSPLLMPADRSNLSAASGNDPAIHQAGPENNLPISEPAASVGLDPQLFGTDPDGDPIDPLSLCVRGPSVLEVRLPSELLAGAELVTTGALHPAAGGQASVQFQVLAGPPSDTDGLFPPKQPIGDNRSVTSVIIVHDDSPARRRLEQAFDDFRQLFPVALCYTKIVPVDEVVTLTLFYREDEPLQRLMLTDQEIRQLDQMWQELHFVSQDALTLVDALEQLLEYATQDADPSVFEPLRQPIYDRAAVFRQLLADSESRHIEALTEFADKAFRRPITDEEAEELRQLYRQLRSEGLAHEEAFRFTLARIFLSPSFLYRLEAAPAGADAAPISDWELASRLSYFLWSSMPDAELREAAASNTLHQPEVLKMQARRMLQSPRVRRLATEFACQWLQIRNFDALDEKSPQAFPEFEELRDDMYEEPIRFFTDFFQRDASVLSLFQADHTFVNPVLAEFYGIPLEADQDTWQRVDGVQRYGRGGILGFATTLARHSGASRTSPILRGNWVSEVLLGEPLPDPPQGVPPFPEPSEATQGLTVRQLTELHSSDPNCARCHQRFDHFGFALENYDAIGRWQERDRDGLAIDAKVAMPDGGRLEAMPGLRNYLAVTRRDAVVRQFCRKLLGYALGRGLMLSDEPLLDQMQDRLAANDYRFSAALDVILESRQFRYIRGRDFAGQPALESQAESNR